MKTRGLIYKVAGFSITFAGFALCSISSVTAGQDRSMNYGPSIDVIGQSTFSTGSDEASYDNAPFIDGTARVGGKIDENIIKNFDFSYQHGYVDHIAGRAPTPTTVVIEDDTDEYRLNFKSTKSLNFALGEYYRYRVCCPAADQAGNAAPSSERQDYVEANYTLPKIRRWNSAVLTVSGRESLTADHLPAAASTLAANPQLHDLGNRAWPSGIATFTLPVDTKHKIQAFGAYSYFYDYYNFSPIPWFYNMTDVGFTKSISPAAIFKIDNSNLVQHKQGYPFTGQNVFHRAKIVMSLDFHFGRTTR